MTDTAFPAIGHIYKADYGDPVFRVSFATDGKTLRWTRLDRLPRHPEDKE